MTRPARRGSASSRDKSLPKISVVTPSLNQGRYLRQCLESIVSQGYKNLEIMVIDGGSTDESVAVIREFESAIAYWVSEPDSGQSDAINKGLARATGEIVAWLNADDFYLPGALARVAEAYAADPAAPFYFGDGLRVDEAGATVSRFFPPDTLRFDRQALVMGLNYLLQPSTFINRRILEQVGLLDTGLHYGMDTDLWLRLSNAGEPRAIPEALSASREYGATKTASGSFGRVEELRRIAMKHSGMPMTPGVLCYLLDTLHRYAQQEQGVFPASYVEDVGYFWNQTQKLLAPYNAAPDGFPRESEAQQTQMSLFHLYRSTVEQIDTLTGWVHEAHAANASMQTAIDELHKSYSAQLAEISGHNTSAFGQVETLTRWVHEAHAANESLQRSIEEQQRAYAAQLEELGAWNKGAAAQIETLTGWVNEARADNEKLRSESEAEKKAHAAQSASAIAQIETLTGWVQEARGANARLESEIEEQKKAFAAQNLSVVKQIETLTAWVHEARDANAKLQNAMGEQQRAHAARIAEMEERNGAHQARIAELDERNGRHQARIAELEERNGAHQARIAEMETRNRAHEARIARMQEQERESAARIAQAEEHKSAQAREIQALRERLARPMVKLALRLSSIGEEPPTKPREEH